MFICLQVWEGKPNTDEKKEVVVANGEVTKKSTEVNSELTKEVPAAVNSGDAKIVENGIGEAPKGAKPVVAGSEKKTVVANGISNGC